MGNLEERICRILKKHRNCQCGPVPPFCIIVSDLVNLVLEICEDCKDEWENKGDVS